MGRTDFNIHATEFKPAKKTKIEDHYYSKFEKVEDIYIFESSKNCPCCKGQVNNCSGEACFNLGICYCVVHLSHNDANF